MSASKEQQLWEACTSGNLDLVKSLASNPAVNVNWVGPERSDTPLHRACRFGHVEVVKVLLKVPKINVNAENDVQGTAFCIACSEGHLTVVSLFLADTRIDVNLPTSEGATPFFFACQQGHKEVVSLLLAEMRIDVNEPNNEQCTSLWFASQEGHLPVIQLILASGREVNTKTKSIAGTARWNNKTAAEIARYQGTRVKPASESEEDYTRKKQNGPLIATLIDSYEQNPQQVRTQLRKQLGLKGMPFSLDSFLVMILLLTPF